jgi:hypothetical protein
VFDLFCQVFVAGAAARLGPFLADMAIPHATKGTTFLNKSTLSSLGHLAGSERPLFEHVPDDLRLPCLLMSVAFMASRPHAGNGIRVLSCKDKYVREHLSYLWSVCLVQKMMYQRRMYCGRISRARRAKDHKCLPTRKRGLRPQRIVAQSFSSSSTTA